jgi:nucleotide-binding universal stress UspA family protein
MKTLLLATDLGPEADLALDRAIQLAVEMPATLTILHVCSAKDKALAEQELDDYLAKKERLKELQYNAVVRQSDDNSSVIISEAIALNVDLIIMGMHRKARIRELFVGTTIERVIRKGVCPLLMVKNKVKGSYGRALVGIDFSPAADRALTLAHELVTSGELYLAHVFHIPDTCVGDKIKQYAGDVILTNEERKLNEYVATQQKLLGSSGLLLKGVNVHMDQKGVHKTLFVEGQKVDAELMSIGAHSAPVLHPFRVGGTAHEILVTPPCDILITPP